jgi:hypothetical protein
MYTFSHNANRRLLTILGALLLAVHVASAAFAQQGVANRAVQRIQGVNLNGPGYSYLGVNGADRGLGYIGSYMTAGGFVPTIGDDFGGIWNADVRGHLSVNNGFFSNVGAVRKQLLNSGALLGIGIFWDYDGDLFQYGGEDDVPGAIFGQFGHVYNQVGVSGEFLTDWGNMRANGYIPVGQTGHQLATKTTAGGIFYQNYMLPVNGLDAALGGADFELGAYVPALAQWAGMINVGGYAYGNTRYTKVGGVDGVETDTPLVPWFGGVYTRLDMTFANNWDFSLQYNNDSFFNSTGFARLTYRMGGSRRRNVPDQMEQPMFRNEHIVRAHETPIAALNPQNNNQFWEVVHVDNQAAPNGDGTIEAPFKTLAEANTSTLVTNNPWTITYVHEGTSSNQFNAYAGSFAFAQPNQFLIGSGGPLTVAIAPVAGATLLTVPAITAGNPVLENKDTGINDGASILIAENHGGATIANITTVGSIIGINGSGNLNGQAQPIGTTANTLGSAISNLGGSSVRNVLIKGDGTAGDQTGVLLAGVSAASTQPRGGIEFTDTQIENTAAQSFQVGDGLPATAGSGGSVNVDYYGSIKVDRSENGNFDNILVDIGGKTGGTINITAGGTPVNARVQNELLDIGGEGIFIEGNDSGTINNIGNLTIVNPERSAIFIRDDSSTTSVTSVATSTYAFGINKGTGDAAIGISGGSPDFSFFGTINNTTASTPNGPIIGIEGVTGSTISIGGPGLDPLRDNADGVSIGATPLLPGAAPVSGSDISIDGLLLTRSGVQMFSVGSTTTFSNLNIEVTDATTPAFIANDGGTIIVNGNSSIINNSNDAASFTIQTAGTNILNTMELNRVGSGKGSADIAVEFSGTTTGEFTITDEFIVGGAQGTAANVTAGSTTVTLPAP